MLEVRTGNEAAFSALYERYHRRVLGFFYGMSHDAELASELCQETFLRIWKMRERYKAMGSFPAYLFTFARNVWREWSRSARRTARVEAAVPAEGDVQEQAVACAWHPGEASVQAEVIERVLAALDRLPEEQRMAFVMWAVEGLPLNEIAGVMDCPVNTVRSRRILAVKKLREALKGMLVL